jgi:predicted outer membrane repeat protein
LYLDFSLDIFYGIPEGQCDCDGNVEDGTGECGGDALVDECGVCNGECYCDTNNRSTIINNSTIIENVSGHFGGGIYMSGASPTITNVVISNNLAQNSGAGAFVDDVSYPIFSNVTFANNSVDSSTSQGGGAIACYHGGSPTVNNSILWNNSPQQIFLLSHNAVSSSITISYSDIQGGYDGITNQNANKSILPSPHVIELFAF